MARRRTSEERERLGAIIRNEISMAENRGDANEASRRQAVNYYLCRPRGDEIKERSEAQSADVRDMTNAVLSMLTPMLAVDSVVEFEPLSEQDEEGAAAESECINKLIIEDNHGQTQIQAAIKDGLLMRLGAMKVWTEDSRSKVKRDLSAGDRAQQLAAANMELQKYGDLVEGVTLSEDGQLEIRLNEQLFKAAAVPIENLCWSSGNMPLQQRRFFAEEIMFTRSELIARGIPKKQVMELGATGYQDRLARDGSADDMRNGLTSDQESINCHDAYLLWDEDGDGISERWRVLVANECEVLEQERVEMIPYALGTPFINPHRMTGESLFDHLKEIQDAKTFFLRQFEDNTKSMVNGKYIYDPARVNESDVMNPVPGGGVRARDPSAVVPMAIPDVGSGVLIALNYQDKRRTEAGGASLDMMQADMQLAGETAHGIERQYASRELLVSMMANNFAETLIRDLYTLMHRFLRAYARRPFSVRVSGQFRQIHPQSWPARTRLNVTVGMTPGQRGHMQQVLGAHIQLQAQAMMAGLDGILANAKTLHASSRALLQIGGIRNPDAMILDPASPAAQQAAKGKQEQAQQQAQQQQQIIARQLAIEERKLAIEERKNADDVAYDYFKTEMDVAMKEAELVGSAELDLEKQARDHRAQAQNNAANLRAAPNGTPRQ
jgi:hypothetical protein